MALFGFAIDMRLLRFAAFAAPPRVLWGGSWRQRSRRSSSTGRDKAFPRCRAISLDWLKPLDRWRFGCRGMGRIAKGQRILPAQQLLQQQTASKPPATRSALNFKAWISWSTGKRYSMGAAQQLVWRWPGKADPTCRRRPHQGSAHSAGKQPAGRAATPRQTWHNIPLHTAPKAQVNNAEVLAASSASPPIPCQPPKSGVFEPFLQHLLLIRQNNGDNSPISIEIAF